MATPRDFKIWRLFYSLTPRCIFMFNFLNAYFSFTRSQRNGIFVLLLLILVLLLFPYFIPLLFPVEEIDFSAFQKEIAAYESQSNALAETPVQQDTAALALFEFDPNELDETGWRKLGVQQKTIRTILNYRNKGGHFYAAEDLLKIYGFDTVKYEQLALYIKIAEEEKVVMNPLKKSVYQPKEKDAWKTKSPERKEKPKYEERKVELNTADSALLVTVNGIGPVLSKRIIKYRNRLGGFSNVNQLMEVYGMDSVWYEKIKPALLVDSLAVVKIPINRITQEELQKHPYFWKNKIAQAICNYRQQHGSFAGIDDLKNIYLLDEALLQKIEPYLSFE